MTASVLNQDPKRTKVQNNAIYCDKTQHANFRGNPLYQATKRHFTITRWKTMKNDIVFHGLNVA